MSKINLLQVMFNFNNYEHHYENVYSSLELAKQVGEIWLENELNLYCSNLTPAKIEHCFDYNGKEIYISGVYIFSYNGKKT